jgi:hypothetical protein
MRRNEIQKHRKNELERARYARNGAEGRDEQRRRTENTRRKHLAIVTAIKLENGCIDCGYRGHPAALHFDHRDPATKSFGISRSLGFSLPILMAEIAKCDVRCANCHAVRSANQKHLGRPRMDPPPASEGADVLRLFEEDC